MTYFLIRRYGKDVCLYRLNSIAKSSQYDNKIHEESYFLIDMIKIAIGECEISRLEHYNAKGPKQQLEMNFILLLHPNLNENERGLAMEKIEKLLESGVRAPYFDCEAFILISQTIFNAEKAELCKRINSLNHSLS